VDISGTVVDKCTSSKYEVRDRIMSIGSVGWSDGGSSQSHVLIHDRDTCKITKLQTQSLSQWLKFGHDELTARIPNNAAFADAAITPLARKASASLAHGKGALCTAVMYKDSENRLYFSFSSCFSGNTQGKLMGAQRASTATQAWEISVGTSPAIFGDAGDRSN
jgi:hypothetical protein